MGCFTGLINLKGCSVAEVPGSVYSLNSLPGISLKAFEQVANSEQQNYIGVWDAINERSEARIKNAILSNLSMRYKILRVKRTLDTVQQPLTTVAAENKRKGIYFNCTFSDDFQLSPFQVVSVDKIRFYYDNTSTATSVAIDFFDFITNEVFYTKTLQFTDLTAGWNEFSINKQFNSANLAIGFNSNNIVTRSYDSGDLQSLWGSFCYDCFNVECGQVQGFVDNQYTSTMYGLQAVVTIGCSFDAAICSNRLLFAEAFWYLLGSEFMVECMYTDRINFMTTVKREEAKELKAHYDLQFEEALKNSLDGIKFDCDVCLECNGLVTVFNQIP